MAGKFIIRLSHPILPEVEWVLFDEKSGEITDPQVSALSDLKKKIQGSFVIILIPSIAIHIYETTIPRTSHSNLLKAIPFALEEKLATSLESNHYALLQS